MSLVGSIRFKMNITKWVAMLAFILTLGCADRGLYPDTRKISFYSGQDGYSGPAFDYPGDEYHILVENQEGPCSVRLKPNGYSWIGTEKVTDTIKRFRIPNASNSLKGPLEVEVLNNGAVPFSGNLKLEEGDKESDIKLKNYIDPLVDPGTTDPTKIKAAEYNKSTSSKEYDARITRGDGSVFYAIKESRKEEIANHDDFVSGAFPIPVLFIKHDENTAVAFQDYLN